MISDTIQSIISIPVPFNMIVLVVLLLSAAGVCGSFFKQVRKFACHRSELSFKRDLLDRGMTADEVEQIVRAHGADLETPVAAKIGCTAR